MHVEHVVSSPGQRLLWFLEHYRGGTGALNCPIVCAVHGDLDPSVLQYAFAALAQRHAALRTTFTGRGRNLQQNIHASAQCELSCIDLRAEASPETALQRAVDSELQTPVDPTRSPLRATLWRVADRRSLFCINMHHLVTDGWSCNLVFRDLLALLQHGSEAPELPNIVWQYPDFVRAQAEFFDNGGLRSEQGYWQRRLAGAQLPALPGASREQPAERPTGTESLLIRRGQVDALRQLAQREHASMFSLTFAIYLALLHRISGQRDLTVASLMANRTRPEIQHTVGFVANMVLLRTRFPAGARFHDLLRAAHASVVEALLHQSLPIQMLAPDSLPKGKGRAEDVVFQMIPNPIDRCQIGTAEFVVQPPAGIGTRFTLELELWPCDGGLKAVLFYRRDRFAPAWARSFVHDYSRLVDAVVRSPGARLAELFSDTCGA
jgi:hypothetical protein